MGRPPYDARQVCRTDAEIRPSNAQDFPSSVVRIFRQVRQDPPSSVARFLVKCGRILQTKLLAQQFCLSAGLITEFSFASRCRQAELIRFPSYARHRVVCVVLLYSSFLFVDGPSPGGPVTHRPASRETDHDEYHFNDVTAAHSNDRADAGRQPGHPDTKALSADRDVAWPKTPEPLRINLMRNRFAPGS